MTRSSLLVAASFALLSGCSGGGGATGGADRGGALADLWAALPGERPRYEQCQVQFLTVYQFGTRYLACTASKSFPLEVVADRAPIRPFRSGPHAVSALSVSLDLDAGRSFGRYDPAFVRWVTDAAVVSGSTARRLVQPIYRNYIARSARVYWLAHERLAAEGYPGALPPGPISDYAAYLEGGPITDAIYGYGGESVSVYALSESLRPILPPGETVTDATYDATGGDALTVNNWRVQTEASTAIAFWLRRHVDGTADEWHQGLRSMLQAYDADWLASHGG